MRSIKVIQQEFQWILAKETAANKKNDKLLYTKQKLKLVQEFDEHLKQLFEKSSVLILSAPGDALRSNNKTNILAKLYTIISYCLRSLAYYFLMGSQLISMVLYSFIGIKEILFLIPGMTNMIAIPFGFILMYVQLRMMCEWEIKFLCNFFAFKNPDNSDCFVVNTNIVKLIKEINKTLYNINNASKINSAKYAEYLNLALEFNNDFKKLKQLLLYKESLRNIIMKYFIIGMQFIMIIADAFFSINILVKLLESMLMVVIAGTPYALLLGGLIMITDIILFFAMGASAMMKSDPEHQNFRKLQTKLSKFSPISFEEKEQAIAHQQSTQRTITPAYDNIVRDAGFIESDRLSEISKFAA